MLSHFLTPWRLRVYPTAALLGVTIGFIAFLATSDGLRSIRGGRVGGDLPAFYGAGRIIMQGTPELLYSPDAQKRAQADLLPGVTDGWIYFSYPPFVAVAYAPFTLLPFKIAYVAHTLLMALCCLLAVRLLRPICPPLHAHFLPVAAATLTFYPLFRANVGGQNTALSLLCAAGAASALGRGRQMTAGLWLAAWLFKPQLALPVVAMTVSAGYPRVLFGLLIGGMGWYFVGALVSGPTWPVWWIRNGVLPFALADLAVDRGNGISFRELAVEFNVAWVGWLLAALTTGFVVASAWVERRRLSNHHVPLVEMASSASVLVSPHALYYDGGIAVLSMIRAGSVVGAALLPHIVGAWLLGAAQILRPYFPLPPLTLVVVASLLFSMRAMRTAAPRTDETPGARGRAA
jgi:hypothetical protein